MNAGFTGLGDLIASHSVDEEPDDGNDDGGSNGSRTTTNHLSTASLPLRKADWLNRETIELP